nr:MAG: putative RNA-dependent RNA polymerase [Narnaviridae sp.]
MREVCDRLIDSLTRGAPGTPKDRFDKKLGKKSPYTPYYRFPGVNTWLLNNKKEKIIILTTNNTVISKLLMKAKKVLTASHVRSTLKMSTVQSWYSKLELYSKIDKDRQKEISEFFSKPNPFPEGQVFFLFNDSYIVEILQFVAAEMSVLIDVIPDFHLRFKTHEQTKLFENTLNIPRDQFIKYIKYHTACPMASVLDQDLPPRPKGFEGHYLLWTGAVKQYLKNILNRRNFQSKVTPLCLKLGMGYLQGIKRGCATVPKSFLYDEIVSHVKAMTTPPTIISQWLNIDQYSGLLMTEIYKHPEYIKDPENFKYKEIRIFSDPIREQFGSCVNAILQPIESEYIPKVYEPSHNASFERGRGGVEPNIHNPKGGAYMEVVERMKLERVESEVLIKGRIGINLSYQSPDMEKVLQECRKTYPSRYNFLEEDVLLKENFPWLYKDPPQKMRVNISNTTVIPLCEPLKVRVITKGEALPAYAAKTLQKTMKSYINRFPSLVLTTRPLVVDDFRQVWAREKAIESRFGINLGFTDHVSGDYKAATDKLNIGFTKLIFERFMVVLNIPQADRDVYRSVLYEQNVHYPMASDLRKNKEINKFNVAHTVKSTTNMSHLRGDFYQMDEDNTIMGTYRPPESKDFVVRQQNGQLMGSILSFPILCLANLVCYKCALDEYINIGNSNGRRKHVNIYDLPVLVNGDDIYFKSNPVFYSIWLKYITTAGFVLSVGKNYVHKSIFTINSQCFSYNNLSDEIREITYLNVGLLIGQSKSGITGEKLPIWDLYNKVTLGAYNKVDAHKRFLYYHHDSIAQVSKCGNYNLFLPKLLGGIGFIRPSQDIPVKITRFQLQLATHFHNKITSAYLTPTKEFKISSVTLIDENRPIAYDKYRGDSIFQFIKIGDDIPEDYQPLNKIQTEEHLFIHTWGNFEPKLKLRSIDSSTLKDFRQSESKYHGDKAWFGLEDALTGRYPYQLVRKGSGDIETYQENLKSVIYKNVLKDINNNNLSLTLSTKMKIDLINSETLVEKLNRQLKEMRLAKGGI